MDMKPRLFTGGYSKLICKNEEELHLHILYELVLSRIDKSSVFEVRTLNNCGQRLKNFTVYILALISGRDLSGMA